MNRNSLAVQWLGLQAFTAEALGSVPGVGTEIPSNIMEVAKKKKKKQTTTFTPGM